MKVGIYDKAGLYEQLGYFNFRCDKRAKAIWTLIAYNKRIDHVKYV